LSTPESGALVARFRELLAVDLGPIDTRRAYGAHGLYRAGLMIGLVQDGVLYLKADEQSRASFAEAGLEAFQYGSSPQRRVRLSYFKAPPRLLDDRDEATVWAQRACEAALRTRPANRRT